jgi:uncharacterized RDD family membrane protein YckC
MYCSKCGVAVAAGSAFCPACGQAFLIGSVPLPTAIISPAATAQLADGGMAYPAYAAVPQVAYAGFWERLLAFVIDNVIIGVGIVVIVIPLLFLTGLGAVLSRIAQDEDLGDAGFFLIFGMFLVAATAIVMVAWLYHAFMESSEWQATVGKRAMGLVVTDMAGRRVSFGRSTGRHFGKIITNLVPAFLGYIMAAFTEKRQALHDMMAGCLVLRRSI